MIWQQIADARSADNPDGRRTTFRGSEEREGDGERRKGGRGWLGERVW